MGTSDNSNSNLLTNFLSNNGKFILFISILLISLYVFKDFIFLNKLYLFKDIGSDTVNYSYPGLVHISDYLRSVGIPKWSFNQGMGQNIFPFSMGNPFDLILYLLGSKYLAYGIVYVELLKIILGGLFFYLYLKTIDLSEYASIVGGVLFSFSGFMILGGGWYLFSAEAVYAALLLYSFEKLFKDDSWTLFPIAIALIGALQPFDLYLYGLFLSLYIVFRIGAMNEDKTNGLTVLLKAAGLGLLGIFISSVFLFSNVLQMIDSPRVSGDASYANILSSIPVFSFGDDEHNFTAIMRLFSNDLLGTGSYYKGWYNYLEAPIFYMGLINLLLAPQIFINLNLRKKILYAAFAAVFILPIIFPYFRHAFWLFTGDYYRGFSLFVALVLLLYSLQALTNIERTFKVSWILLTLTLFTLLAALFFPYSLRLSRQINDELKFIIALFLTSYAVLIYFLSVKKYKAATQIILFLTILLELSYFSSITVNKRFLISAGEFRKKLGYNDYTTDAVSYLNIIDKSFYRIIKHYSSGPAIHLSINDAKVQNFKGTSSYHSFNQLNYVKFLQEVNEIDRRDESQTRWAIGLVDRPFLQPLASVKYHLIKGKSDFFLNDRYEAVATFNDVQLFKDRYYLPLGYTYDHFLTISDFRRLQQLQKDVVLLNAFIVDDSEIKKYGNFKPLDINTIANKKTEDSIRELRQETLFISKHSQNYIKGEINLSSNKLMFLSIPFDRGWHAKVDDKKVKLEQVNIGFMGLPLTEGTHTIELEFEPPFLLPGAMISLASIAVYFVMLYRRSRTCCAKQDLF